MITKNLTHTQRYKRIKEFNDTHEDTPDGAFFGIAQEQGIYLDDWVWFANQCQFDKDYNPKKKIKVYK